MAWSNSGTSSSIGSSRRCHHRELCGASNISTVENATALAAGSAVLIFYIITHLFYGVKTAKVLCSRGLAGDVGIRWEAAALCGSSSHWMLAALMPPGLASLARQVVSLTQASRSDEPNMLVLVIACTLLTNAS